MKLPALPETLPAIDPEIRGILESDAKAHVGWADFQNRWGLVMLLEGDVEPARAVFARCLELNPQYAWAALNHVQAVALGGDVRGARSRLVQTPEPAPGSRAMVQAFLDLLDPTSASGDPFADLAEELRRRPDFQKVRALLDRGTPSTGEVRGILPGVYQLMKEVSTWEARFGREARAQEFAAAMLACWHDRGSYWTQAGFLAALRGEDEVSLRSYEEAARVAPHSPEALIALAFHWSAAGEPKPAHAALTEALRRAPRFADLQYQLGLLEDALGNPDASLAAFRAALAINPQYSVARLHEAETLVQLERWEDAREAYVRVLDAGLQSTDLYLHLGQVEERLGRPAVAEEAYRAALRLNPDEPMVHFHLGHLHRERGDRDKAKRAWRRYLVLAGETEQAETIRAQLEADLDS